MSTYLPFFSVVLSTYNGSKTLVAAIESLINQSYPKDKFEIIVVDDGSTDNTYNIAKSYNLTIYRHDTNLGLSSGRNTGLNHAKGDVYVCFDDDGIAEKDWLINLAKLYSKSNIMGGGCLVKPATNSSLMDIFFNGINYANPLALSNVESKHPVVRFLLYIIQMIENSNTSREDIYKVTELSGASSSFKISYLKEIGGWDEKLSGVEDLDLCIRLKKKYPEKSFYATNNTCIIHDHRLTVSEMAFYQYTRGIVKYYFYKRNNTVPPFFPFPTLYLLTIIFSWLLTKTVLIPASLIVILPQMLYFWWVLKCFSTKNLKLLLIPYIHLIYESAIILGLLTGMSKLPIYRRTIR